MKSEISGRALLIIVIIWVIVILFMVFYPPPIDPMFGDYYDGH